MKKVGIYGGSFNPIHFGHVGVAKWILENTDLDEVWFLVSPNNPLKDTKILAPEEERLAGVREAIKDIPGLVASDFEFSLPRPSYMSKTLYELHVKYNKYFNRDYEFTLIIGEDSLEDFDKWHLYEYILESFRVFVYPRKVEFDGVQRIEELKNKVLETYTKTPEIIYLEGAPYFDISSTKIRNARQVIQTESKIVYTDQMTEELYEWLREQWRRSNIPKYQHLFEPWVNNLTDSQIYYFSKQKENIEKGSLTNWITRR